MQDKPPFHTPSSTTSPGTPFAFTLTTALCAMRALKRGTMVAFSHMLQCASTGLADDECLDDFIATRPYFEPRLGTLKLGHIETQGRCMKVISDLFISNLCERDFHADIAS